MQRFFLISILFLTNLSSTYAQAPQQIQGSWSTYFQRINGGIVKVDMHVSDLNIEAIVNIQIEMPLFPADVFETKITGKFQKFESTTDLGTFNFSYTVDRYYKRFFSTSEILRRNIEKYCGKSNWKLGVYNDITGLICKEHAESEVEVIHKDEVIGHLIMFNGENQFYSEYDFSSNFDEEVTEITEPIINKNFPFYRIMR